MRGDVVAHGWGETKTQVLVIDVTVNNGLAPSIVGDHRAVSMERQKRDGELGRFCAARSDVYVFVPFAVEVLGRLGPSGIDLVRQLSFMICQRLGPAAQSSMIATSLYQGLSRTVTIGEDLLMQHAAHSLFGAPMGATEDTVVPCVDATFYDMFIPAGLDIQ